MDAFSTISLSEVLILRSIETMSNTIIPKVDNNVFFFISNF